MAVDILGGVFSLLSLVFKIQFLPVAAVTYIAVIVLDAVVVVLAMILNPMARKRRAREAGSMDGEQPQSRRAMSDSNLPPNRKTSASVSLDRLKVDDSQRADVPDIDWENGQNGLGDGKSLAQGYAASTPTTAVDMGA
ncbi:hypothetical protein FRB96_007506 [Tulasnella sp. 330]|nr:hypothetical protein FRB96_007506 [Tulasnella sp. 330]KAG8887560.1 hypothetical protein FRB98_009466 [Tulasnella sp. 332]